jgi:hypothetical protein
VQAAPRSVLAMLVLLLGYCAGLGEAVSETSGVAILPFRLDHRLPFAHGFDRARHPARAEVLIPKTESTAMEVASTSPVPPYFALNELLKGQRNETAV